MKKYVKLLIGTLMLSLFSFGAQADVITDLFNTGVDANGDALAGGVADPHYSFSLQPGHTNYTATVVPDGYPVPPWNGNDATARWIGPDTTEAQGPAAHYRYETTFTLPTLADLASVLITGKWATDDPGTNIWINGISTGQTTSWNNLSSFTLSSGFVAGVNTIEFGVYNSGGPTGLLVKDLVGTFTSVPAPMTVFVALVGLIGLALRRRVV